jgi:hypothetical protein
MSVEIYVELQELPIDFAYLEFLREEREPAPVACPQEDVARLWATAVKLINKSSTSRVGSNEKELALLRRIRAVLRRLMVCGIDVAEELIDVKSAIRFCKSVLKERKRLLKTLRKRGRTGSFCHSCGKPSIQQLKHSKKELEKLKKRGRPSAKPWRGS